MFFQRITYGHSGTGVYPILRRALLDDAGAVASAYFDFSDLEYSIEHESAMVFFDTVFPFGGTFDLEVRRTRITLIDQYCLNSRCSCSDGVLSAIRTSGTVDETDDTPLKPHFTVIHDYRTHTTTVMDELDSGSAGTAAAAMVMSPIRSPRREAKPVETSRVHAEADGSTSTAAAVRSEPRRPREVTPSDSRRTA